MPFLANDENGDRVKVSDAERGDSVYCVGCGNELHVVGGKDTRVTKHFRHATGDACYEYDSHEETEAHISAKESVRQYLERSGWASDIAVEEYLSVSKPDLLFSDGKDRFAVEIQVSSISADDIRHRTLKHSSQGVYTLWLFHRIAFGEEKTSRNGNIYATFKTGEMGYRSMTDQPGDECWINYYDPDRDGGIGQAVKLSLFEDSDGGFIQQHVPIERPVGYLSKNKYRIAATENEAPDEQTIDTDDDQSELFRDFGD